MIKFDQFEKIVAESQMNTFLKTSLNTELVITILKGIVILAASSSDNIDHMDDADMYRIKQVQTVELKKIKIKDASKFTIDEQGKQEQQEEANNRVSGLIGAETTRGTQLLDSDTETDQEDEDEPA